MDNVRVGDIIHIRVKVVDVKANDVDEGDLISVQLISKHHRYGLISKEDILCVEERVIEVGDFLILDRMNEADVKVLGIYGHHYWLIRVETFVPFTMSRNEIYNYSNLKIIKGTSN